MEKLDAAWYTKVIAERRERLEDCMKQIEFAHNQIKFWTEFEEQERNWLKVSEDALAQALAWEKEYKNENPHL